MFNCLVVEGWRTSTLLPQGWMFKIQRPAVINFFNKDGVFKNSFEKMRSHMKISHKISKEDIQNLNILESTINEIFLNNSKYIYKDVVDNNQQNYFESDSSNSLCKNLLAANCLEKKENIKKEFFLPTGWIVKERSLVSSSGIVYSSLKAAIIALRKEGGQEKIVQAILKLPGVRSWSTRNLPLGWIIKGTTSKYNIIGPDISFFESKSKAIDHLIALGGSEQDKILLDNFCEGGKKRKVKFDKIKEHIKQCTENYGEAEKNMPITQLKEYSVNFNNRENHMTGLMERQALQEVLRSGAGEKDAVPFRSALIISGWKMEGLPSGWMGKGLPHSGYR